jgi:hypothetical protein
MRVALSFCRWRAHAAHISRGRILALAAKQKSLTRFKWFPFRLEEVGVWGSSQRRSVGARHLCVDAATLEATQGRIVSQTLTDATRFWWCFHGS